MVSLRAYIAKFKDDWSRRHEVPKDTLPPNYPLPAPDKRDPVTSSFGGNVDKIKNGCFAETPPRPECTFSSKQIKVIEQMIQNAMIRVFIFLVIFEVICFVIRNAK